MNLVNEIIEQIQFNASTINATLDMQGSTESLDLIDTSKYQSEIFFNQLLPYADKIDKEADSLLADIKANLGHCLMLRDINPGCVFWTQMLNKYILLYGLRFTKEEHVAFIKISYELITIPNLQPTLVDTFSKILLSLIKKKETISPDDLEIDWEPLFKLSKAILLNRFTQYKLQRNPIYLEVTMENLVVAAKTYFRPSATQEILDELRPNLCPLDEKTMNMTFRLLRWFLPLQLPPEQHAIGHELWFHEIMKLWEVCHNAPVWENDLMKMLAKLASSNVGYIDWNPYVPLMFTRFVRTLSLPVHYKKKAIKNKHNIEMCSIAEWIASVLSDHSNAQIYLEKFLKTIETYFHPANWGPWLPRLEKLFIKMINFVVLRIQKERYPKDSWEARVPDSHRLTDANIDAFVNATMPVTMIGIFNKRCSPAFALSLQYLATLRPNVVIPTALEKLYPSLDADIEPHKLITVMISMSAIARPLIQGSHFSNRDYAFPEGPSHALPLLFASLPGIDPNDHGKCFATLRMIMAYVSMIPIVDCSQLRVQMSEEERTLCMETARFEDFVLQFLDKMFVLIESSSVEFVRLESQSNDSVNSMLETMAFNAVHGVLTSVLLQCSDSIFISALHKFRSFIMQNTLERKIAGQLVALMCGVFAHVNSHITLKALLPYLSEKILQALGEDDEVLKEENLDNELLYLLLLLIRLMDTQGDALLHYLETITNILDKVTRFKSREGHLMGCQMLMYVLRSLCNTDAIRLDRNLDDLNYPYWKDWGESVHIKSAQIRWYIPGEQEMAAAQSIFARYFLPAVDAVQNYISTDNSLTRDELQATLRIISYVLEGCSIVLPMWKETPVVTKPFESCVAVFEPNIGNAYEIQMPDGSNVREFLIKTLTSLQETLLKNVEDDTKSLFILLEIWLQLAGNTTRLARSLSARRKYFYSMKKLVEIKLTRNKGYVPEFLLERVVLQHKQRLTHAVRSLTQIDIVIISNLFKLSIGQYSAIRKKAQSNLWSILNDFPNAYQIIIPNIMEILTRDTEIHHDAYKGVLFLIIQNQGNSLLTKGDWKVLSDLLPALVLSKPSEKPSIIRQHDFIVSCVTKNFTTTNITLEVPDSCVNIASMLWNVGLEPSSSPPSIEEVRNGITKLQELGNKNLKAFNSILDNLMNAILEKNLHWRHRQMAVLFIGTTLHPDHALPASVVRYFLNAMIHDSIDERKLAWTMTMYVFKQLKRKHPKVIKVLDTPKSENGFNPGLREDNAWLQYSSQTQIVNAEQWDEPRYVHKQYIGYYTWPKKLEIYAPTSQQPVLDKSHCIVNKQEKEVDLFFSDKQNIDTLIQFLTLEEKKGKDKFHYCRYLLFKGLFRNHGDTYLAHFLPHLHKMVQDKQDSVQRCAAEIICGLIRGAKHWPFQMSQDMWQSLIPIIKLMLANITEETVEDWYACFTFIHRNRDPSRLHWLIECLVEESQLVHFETSFNECARLLLLQAAIKPLAWRMGELLNRLLSQLENRLLQNPFENVRDQLASILVSIFNTNYKFQKTVKESNETDYPEIEDFVNKVYPQIELLLTEKDGQSSTYIKSTRLLTTVCRFLMQSVMTAHCGGVSSFFKLYPIIAHLENNDNDEELSKTCTSTLAVLSRAFTMTEHVPAALEAIEKVSNSSSWSARASSLQFLQVLLFHNMSTLLSDERWIDTIRSIVLRLLQDDRVEVRESSAQVLNGMLHCTLLSDRQILLEKFKTMAKTKLNSKKKSVPKPNINNAISLRHAGVLGMCAFIQAHPYDIPKDIPPIFEDLSLHLNDPEPIPTTIRKTLNDFKRTHCDGWTGLQGLAQDLTEEQFALLQDLIVPPSYYA